MKFLKLLGLMMLIVGVVGYYLYNKPNSSLEDTTPAYTLTSDALFSDFESDEAGANKKYLNQVIEVSGKVQTINNNPGEKSISLETSSGMFGVICKLDSTFTSEVKIVQGDSIVMKGLCTGMLMDVILVRSVPVNK
jgi:hypothetical protein